MRIRGTKGWLRHFRRFGPYRRKPGQPRPLADLLGKLSPVQRRRLLEQRRAERRAARFAPEVAAL